MTTLPSHFQVLPPLSSFLFGSPLELLQMSSEVVGVDVSSIEVVVVNAVQIVDILPYILFLLFLISLRLHLSNLDRWVIGGEFSRWV